jgi:hypothetical protein
VIRDSARAVIATVGLYLVYGAHLSPSGRWKVEKLSNKPFYWSIEVFVIRLQAE